MRKIPLEYDEQLQFRGLYSHRLRRNKSNGYVSLQKRDRHRYIDIARKIEGVCGGAQRERQRLEPKSQTT